MAVCRAGMVAEFEADLIRARTREGMAVAKAKGRLKGKQPKLSKTQRKHLLMLHGAGEHTQAELSALPGMPLVRVQSTSEIDTHP